ncbi:MAG: hypothetical protein KJ057_03725 [Phycisphaerae bacterium]|nr:MAG: hypothetical protein EDS66_06980 [Planctomycetota bacterium]KAB2948655.1 MAG: hypothetical protein F9K17_05875 [Phycisphaerae bacterium]MBE7457760.1 hypothetical protein [Planctomycetia bacterium]MCK6463721.1 hypothetical protein [Phycisphaerae bacterium]MCL4717564.1 hypothetical protein [Phycisphaerae bacterium]
MSAIWFRRGVVPARAERPAHPSFSRRNAWVPVLCLAGSVAIAASAQESAPPVGEAPAATAPESVKPEPSVEQVRTAITRGLGFLAKDQNPDGSWGGLKDGTNTFTGDVWSNPETHLTWKVATTGLCVLALLEAGGTPEDAVSLNKGIDYLLANPVLRRPSDWDTMNCWANIYALQALAEVAAHPRFAESPQRDRIREVAAGHARQLTQYQSVNGGWGYLEFDIPRTRRPQWSTSFTTAAAVIALQDAKRCGIEVDAKTIERGARAIRQCRLPTGAFTYSVNAIPSPGGAEWIDQIKGSLSRIQVCNLALLYCGDPVTQDTLRWGMDVFFEHHRWLDNALHKPIPHETYYLNSGYFYLFGHYYAARVLELLPETDRVKYRAALQREVMKIQGTDGAIWDYPMHAYDKPYGAAFGVMALQRSLKTPDRPSP